MLLHYIVLYCIIQLMSNKTFKSNNNVVYSCKYNAQLIEFEVMPDVENQKNV